MPHDGRSTGDPSEVRDFALDKSVKALAEDGYGLLGAGELRVYIEAKPSYDLGVGLAMTKDQSFDEFIEAFAAANGLSDRLAYEPIPRPAQPPRAEATECHLWGTGTVHLNDVKISLKRTLRVPDTGKVHALPCDAGTLPLAPVPQSGPAFDALPRSIREAYAHTRVRPADACSGGLMTCLRQREAIWISLKCKQDYAYKVSAGGINAITGRPSSQAPRKGQQDCETDPQPH